MAREAGDDWDSTLSTDKEFLKRFEALVRADEREACATECERMMMYPNAKQESAAHQDVWAAAKAIRARSNK
jgi:hypothetical protein